MASKALRNLLYVSVYLSVISIIVLDIFIVFRHQKSHLETYGNVTNGRLASYSRSIRQHPPPVYLLALGYSEQLSAATHSVLQLGSLASDLNALLVEPTVVTSHVFGVKGVYPPMFANKLHAVMFFDVYNASKVNRLLRRHFFNVKMSSFQKFLINTPQNITLLHFNTRSSEETKRIFALSHEEVSFLESKEEAVIDCLLSNMTVLMEYVEKLEQQLWNLSRQKKSFHILRALCLNPQLVYNWSDVVRRHLPPSPGIVVFTNWHGCALRKCSLKLKKISKLQVKPPDADSFRYAVLTRKELDFKIRDEFSLHLPRFEKTALAYLERIKYLPSSYISLHVRSERVLRNAKLPNNNMEYLTLCVQSVVEKISTILNRWRGSIPANTSSHHQDQDYRNTQSVLLITDMSSQYGSDSCGGRKCRREHVHKIHQLLGHIFDFQSYRPEALNTSRNSGVVSLVEMYMLSLGRELVLVGSGGFQSNLEHLFLSKGHTINDIHHIMC